MTSTMAIVKLAFLTLGFTALVLPPLQIAKADTLIRAGQVLDVESGKYSKDVGILIVGDQIARIDSWSAFATTAVAAPTLTIIDLSNKTVMPGLIDAHTHLMSSEGENSSYLQELATKSIPYRALEGAFAARKTLLGGFTTVRDVESEGAGFADVALRDAIEAGLTDGPRMLVATRGLVALGAYYPRVAPEYQNLLQGAQNISGPEDARRAVREQIAGGADLIKMYADFPRARRPSLPTLSLEEMQMIVAEARRAGSKVAAHAVTPAGIKSAVAAGADSIEHGWDADDEALKMMAANNVALVPTTSGAFARDPVDTKFTAKLQALLVRAQAYGVTIVAGSDSSEVKTHGRNANELIAMAKLGLTPLKAVQAATVNAASLLGLTTKVGTIAVGKKADIIAVDVDPLLDLSTLSNVVFVMKAGKVYRDRL